MSEAHLASGPVDTVRSLCGSVTVDLLPDRSVVRCVGEIDLNLTTADLEPLARSVQAAGAPVHVDCAEVSFFSAAGMSLLVALSKAAPGGQLSGLTTSPAVDLVLRAFPEHPFPRS